MGLLKFIFSKAFFKQIGLAIIVFGVLFYGLVQWLSSTTNHNEFVTVPSIIGKDSAAAKTVLEAHGLKLGDVEYKNYNPEFPKAAVVEQQPEQGFQVKEGRKIYVSINKSAYRLVTIPDLSNKTKREVESTLKAIGFVIGKISYKPHFAKDALLELQCNNNTVKPNSTLPYTSVIDLVLGDGKLNYSGN